MDLYAFGDVMAAAAVLKQFLRELEDAPLTGAHGCGFGRGKCKRGKGEGGDGGKGVSDEYSRR